MMPTAMKASASDYYAGAGVGLGKMVAWVENAGLPGLKSFKVTGLSGQLGPALMTIISTPVMFTPS